MKKILIFLMALNLVSYANIKSNFNYEINFNKRLDYEKENEDKEDDYKYIFKTNDYKTTRQLAKINGEFKGDSGLLFKYHLESSIKVKDFKQLNSFSNLRYIIPGRDLYNPNLNFKPHLDIALGFDKTFKLSDDLSIKNKTYIKYIVSALHGLEFVEEKQLDLSQSIDVLSKNINFNLNGSYSSINLFNPIEYKLGLSLDKDIKNQNLKLKLDVNHKLDDVIIENKIQDTIAFLSLKEYEDYNYSIYLEDYMKNHQRRILKEAFEGKLNSYLYLIPELTLEYKNKINDNLKLSLSNTTKYDLFRYSGTLDGYKKKLIRSASVGQTETKEYKASFDEIKNTTKFQLAYDDKKLKNTSNINLEYIQSIYENDYKEENKESDAHSFHFYNILSTEKRNFRALNLELENKSSYKIDLNSKLSLTPSLDLKYTLNGERIISNTDDQERLKTSIENDKKNLEKVKQALDKSKTTTRSVTKPIINEFDGLDESFLKQKLAELIVGINSKENQFNRTQKFNINHKLTVNPRIAMNYSFDNGINFYTKVSIPFTFKTRSMEDPRGKLIRISNRHTPARKFKDKFAPNNFNVKVTSGIKFNF